MVDDTHLVGFGVADAKLDVVGGSARRGHARVAAASFVTSRRSSEHGLFVKRARHTVEFARAQGALLRHLRRASGLRRRRRRARGHRRFFATSPTHAGSLIVNGDLFEFWFEWRTVIPRGAFRTLAALADVVDAGVPVTMIAGNHDCWGGDVLRNDVGSRLPVRPSGRGRRRLAHAHRARRRPASARGPALSRAAPRAPQLARHSHLPLAASRPRDSRSRSGSSHASRNYAARDRGRGLRDAAERVAAANPRSTWSSSGTRTSPTLERLHRRSGVRQRRLLARRADVSAHHRRHRVAPLRPVGRLSRESGSRRLPSCRQEIADLAAGTAADRRTRRSGTVGSARRRRREVCCRQRARRLGGRLLGAVDEPHVGTRARSRAGA